MDFVRLINGYDHLWAVKYPEKDADELTLLFRNWSNFNYLLDLLLLQEELDKMNRCRDFLNENGIFDQDSFIDFVNGG